MALVHRSLLELAIDGSHASVGFYGLLNPTLAWTLRI